VKLQVLLAPTVKWLGEHESDAGGTIPMETVTACERPLSAAVTVIKPQSTFPTVPGNVTEALVAGTLTVAGTLNLALLLVTVTEVKEETVCERVIVQVVDVDVAMAVGVHASEETSTAILKESVWVAPYPAAVKVTLREPPVIVPEVTVKFAEAEPAGTLTDVGALS
jgi:hypothetical protein